MATHKLATDASIEAPILLVDDSTANLVAYQALLEPLGQPLVLAHSGDEALRELLHREFALVLMDVAMPELNGLETARLIRARQRTRHVPIIFLTAFMRETAYIYRGYSEGAVDYLFKPVDPEVLLSKARVFIGLHQQTIRLRRAEAALREKQAREARARFATLIEAMPHGVWSGAISGETEYANRAWRQVTGVDSVGPVSWSRVHPEDAPAVARSWQEMLGTGTAFEKEFRLGSDHQYRWQLGRSVPSRDEAGKPLGWIATLTDIDDRKRAEARERALLSLRSRRDAAVLSRRRWGLLAEASGILAEAPRLERVLRSLARRLIPQLGDVCLVDLLEDGGRRFVRAAVGLDGKLAPQLEERLLRAPPDPTGPWGIPDAVRTGRCWYSADVASGLGERGGRWSRLGALGSDAVEVEAALGIRSVYSAPVTAGRGVCGALTLLSTFQTRRWSFGDRTLISQVAQRLGAAVESARLFREVKDAVQVREDFLAVAAHELRTPVTALRLVLQNAERLAPRMATDPQAAAAEAELLHRARHAEERLGRLIEAVLDVSQLQSGRLRLTLEKLDLGELVRGAVGSLAADAEKVHCQVTIDAPRKVEGLWDKSRLEQVVINLVANALKYGRGRPVEIRVGANARGAELQVRDHGIGIARQHHQRIFERFERAVGPHSFQGLGLGLYIVRQILDAMGAEIRVESAPGEGACFTVTLPQESRTEPKPVVRPPEVQLPAQH